MLVTPCLREEKSLQGVRQFPVLHAVAVSEMTQMSLLPVPSINDNF